MDEDARRFQRITTEHGRYFRGALDAPKLAQEWVLTDIVTANRETAFGREHDWAGIRDIAAFRRNVPIRDYEGLAPWIDRVAAGEDRVLTYEKPIMFARTSGTSAEPKRIPTTRSDLLYGRTPPRHAMWAHLLSRYPEILEHPHSVLDLMMDARKTKTHLAGIPYQGYSSRDFSLGSEDWDPPWSLASRVPEELGDYSDRIYFRLRGAVEENLRGVVTYNPSSLLSLAEHLKGNQDRLIDEVRHGMVLGKPGGRPNPKRADQLAELASRGDFRPCTVWPGMRFVLCWKSATAKMYLPKLEALFGRADVRPNYTSSSEGLIAVPVDDHPSAGLLAVTNAFYEFVPVAETAVGQNHALSLDQLEVGKQYQVIMTLRNGLFRYAIGDVLEVLEYVGGVPRVEFLGRSNVASSFTGEKLTEQQVHGAISRTLETLKIAADNFTCLPRWDSPPYYELVLDLNLPGSVDADKVAAIAAEFDKELSRHNDEYLSKRGSGRLGATKVRIGTPLMFERYMQHCVAKGTMPSQYKLKVLQKDDAFLQLSVGAEA